MKRASAGSRRRVGALPLLRRTVRRGRPRAVLWLAVLAGGLGLALLSCRTASRQAGPEAPPRETGPQMTPPEEADAAMNDPNLIWNCSSQGLDSRLLTALRKAAAEYAARTGQPIVVNSGARTLRRQAELMAEMSQDQLEGMYCRQGYPGYVSGILAARKRNGGSTDADAVYEILRQRDGGYISAHLSGAAVDVSPAGADVDLLRSLLEEHDFVVLDERGLGVDCLHATYRYAPRRIVRE